MNILVTGGCGYIGSHAVLRLVEAGHAVTVVDDLSRGHKKIISIIRPLGDVRFVQDDLGHRDPLALVMRQRAIDLVMHFGALAYVGESVEQPLRYYRKNAGSSLGLLEAMDEAGVNRIVFSSTCATYGKPTKRYIPISEKCPQKPINPYGRSKLMVEQMIEDYAAAKHARDENFSYAFLRYFNVAGCDQQARLGEDHDPETHLIPICLEVALGLRPHITIFGTDYDTEDGTCIRDYVHVDDLIDAHIAAMDRLTEREQLVYNVGIGRGYSVREVIDAARSVTGQTIKTIEGERRPGDPPALYNNPRKINTDLGWEAQITDLKRIIETAWNWRKQHPRGYED